MRIFKLWHQLMEKVWEYTRERVGQGDEGVGDLCLLIGSYGSQAPQQRLRYRSANFLNDYIPKGQLPGL